MAVAVLPLPTYERAPMVLVRRTPPQPTIVFDTYWRFAVERQELFFRRLAGAAAPWTTDPILGRYRFTNAYRAADRTSQALIREAIYEGSGSSREVFFRTVLFRLFNLPDTWRLLSSRLDVSAESFDPDAYARVLATRLAAKLPIYSAAYVIPPVPQMPGHRKHEQHLNLIAAMLQGGLDEEVYGAASLAEVFTRLAAYPSLGRFLAFQLAVDLNYGPHLAFDEDDFVVAGPGAHEGIAKCFEPGSGWSDEDVIRWVADRQELELAARGLTFRSLWGRRLHLIDVQNLFCEIAKYSRAAHPEFTAVGGRQRIKRVFSPQPAVEWPWFPPKWGINESIGEESRNAPPGGQVGLPVEQLDFALA